VSAPVGSPELLVHRARGERAGALLVWVGCGVTLVLVALGLTAGLPTTSDVVTIVTGLTGSLAAVSLALVGAVLVTRVPRNPIGWLLWAGGLLFGAANGLSTPPTGAGPAQAWVAWLAWLGNLCWVPALVLVALFVPLVFPTGRLPSRRWRVVVGLGLAALVISELQAAFTPFPPGTAPPGVSNPLALGGAAASLLDLGSTAATLTGVVCIPLAAASLLLRYRRATGTEQAQLRWFAAAAGLVGLALAIALPLGNASGGIALALSNAAWLAVLVGLALLPVAIGIAILRYRLYEIDLLINRTAVYGSVTALLLAAVGVANLLLQRLAESVTGQHSDLVAAALGAAAAITFAPLRRRVRPLVDRVLPGRAMLTLLFTDIVGSTATLAELGDARWRGVLAQYLDAVRQELARSRGHEVNTAGDAFFATFERPLDGLRCAWSIRSAVRELGLETRTGLHLGECEMRGEQPSGLAVHTAARVMGAAGDGEILVSAAMRDALAQVHLALVDRGRHELRGVPGEWQLYAAEPGG
jgi:class 3 adenylate cyclase